jgi:hypothetical protein
LRGGTAAGRGAASFITETIARVRDAGATGELTLRTDSGFYADTAVSASRRAPRPRLRVFLVPGKTGCIPMSRGESDV